MTPEVKEKIEQIRHGIVPEGYTKTAAGIIPNDWQCSAIRDCLKIKNNERQPICEEVRRNIPGPYPYYGPTQAQGYIDSYVSEGPAVLIGEDGDHFLKFKTKPMTLFVDGQYTVNNHAHMVVGTEQCTTKWFFYAYQHKSLLNAITRQGAGRYKLTKEALERLVVQYPCLEEQNRIIDIISRQDSVIELKEKLLEEKQRQKKYLMQQLLTGKKRLPGFDGKWDIKELGEISIQISERAGDNRYEVLSISANKGFVNQSEKFGKDISGAQYSKYTVIRRGHFSYNKGNSKHYPQGCIYLLEDREVAAVPNVFISFELSQTCCNEYYKYLFEAGYMNRQLYRLINSGVRNDGLLNLNDSDFFACSVPIPPYEEQVAISRILTKASKEIDLIRRDLEQEKQKKKALMQLLLTGIVRV